MSLTNIRRSDLGDVHGGFAPGTSSSSSYASTPARLGPGHVSRTTALGDHIGDKIKRDHVSEEKEVSVTERFCYMMFEEFLMRKGLTDTLSMFRTEWQRPSDDALFMSWEQICLKLHLEDTSARPGFSVAENVVDYLVSDAATRMRKHAKSDIVEGLASLPRLRSAANGASVTTNSVNPPDVDPAQAPAGSTRYSWDNMTEAEMMEFLKRRPKDKVGEVEPAQTETKAVALIPKRYKKNRKTKLHLDSSSSEAFGGRGGKLSNQNWIPEVLRFKSLQRDLLVAKENLQSALVVEMETNKELKRLTCTDLERAHVEESLGSKRKKACGCCMVLFSAVNLTLNVSIKAVTDLRKKWIAGKPSGYEDADVIKMGNMPKCYDQVSVCRFCSQFFYDQDSYRPTFDKIAHAERKAAWLDTKRREREYWDPLLMCAKDEEAEAEATGEALGDDLRVRLQVSAPVDREIVDAP
jgi:hypothetical protein